MLNSKNKKVIEIIILIISIVFWVIILLIPIKNYKKQDNSYSGKFIEIVDRDEESQLKEKELENYEIKIKKELDINLKGNKDNLKIKQEYYAIGVIKYLQNKTVQSIECLNKALEYGGIDSSNKDSAELDIKIYSALSSNYIIEKKMDKSDVFFEQAKIIALKNNRKDMLCELYYGKAKSVATSGYNINDSIDLMRKSLEYTDSESHKIRNYLYLSTLYKLIEKFDLSLEYTINALQLSMKLKDSVNINKCVISLGEIYYVQNNYAKTIYIYESHFKENKFKDDENKLIVYGYLAECYAREGNYEKYRMYKEKYIKLANKKNDIKNIVWIYAVCADIEVEFSNIDNAKKYLNKGQDLYDKNKEYMYSNIDIMLDFAKAKIDYFENKDYTKALKSYQSIIERLNKTGIKSDINSVVISGILTISLENDDIKVFKKYMKMLENCNKKESDQTYTEGIYTEINNTIKEKKLFKERIKTLILFILSIVSIYELINSKRKNKKISELNRKLKELNILDPLTNLYNRGYLKNQFKGQQIKEKVTFIMMDIDYFKLYNDNYGHIKGDQVLIEVANTIKYVFKDDMVFRYGGEEFSVISHKTEEEIIKTIDDFRVELHKQNITHEYSKVSDRITLSIGIAWDEVSSENDWVEITKLADANLYKSKQEGRDRYTYTNINVIKN